MKVINAELRDIIVAAAKEFANRDIISSANVEYGFESGCEFLFHYLFNRKDAIKDIEETEDCKHPEEFRQHNINAPDVCEICGTTFS